MRLSYSVIAALMAIVVASPTLAAPAVRRDKVCPAKDDENSNLKAQVIEGDKLNCQYEAAGGCVYFLGNGNFSSGSSTCPDAGLDANDPAAGKIVNGKVNIDQGMNQQPPMKEEQPAMNDQKPPMKDEQPMMHEPPMQEPPMPMHEPPMQQEKPKEQPPMMHDPPMQQTSMMHEPPMTTQPMMHEPPMTTSTMMHEPPMTTTMMHEPPMTTPPPMHEPPMQQENPKQEPPMTHEPPMQQAPPPPPPANKPLEDCLSQCKMAMPPSMMMGHMRR